LISGNRITSTHLREIMMTRVPTFALSNTLFILVIASVLAVLYPVAAHGTHLPCQERALQELFPGVVTCNLASLCNQQACSIYRDARAEFIARGCDYYLGRSPACPTAIMFELVRNWMECTEYLERECMNE
jgi:hypothetical protein